MSRINFSEIKLPIKVIDFEAFVHFLFVPVFFGCLGCLGVLSKEGLFLTHGLSVFRSFAFRIYEAKKQDGKA